MTTSSEDYERMVLGQPEAEDSTTEIKDPRKTVRGIAALVGVIALFYIGTYEPLRGGGHHTPNTPASAGQPKPNK